MVLVVNIVGKEIRLPIIIIVGGSNRLLGICQFCLYDVNIQSGNTGLSGSAADWTFAYQFLGGVRAFVTTKLFVFGEYKYYVAKYSWDSEGAGNTKIHLDFQTHLVSGGLGWSF